MKIYTTARPKHMPSPEYPGMKIACLPVVVTDEHAASSYGVPVIVDHAGLLYDYSQFSSVSAPQSDETHVYEPLWSGEPSAEYGDVVRFLQRMPVEIQHLPNYVQ